MKLSLRNKIQLTVFLIVAGSSVFLYIFFNNHQKTLIKNSFEQGTLSFAVTLALGVQSGIEVGDFAAMKRAVDFARADPEMLFVAILDEEDTTIAAYPKNFKYEELNPANWEKGYHTAMASFDAEDLKGKVVIGRRTEQYEKDLRQAQIVVSLVSLVALFIGITGAFWLARSIAIPILKIKDAADWIGKGNLMYRVEITAHDEIGELADAFNQMAGDIQRYLDAAQAAMRAKGEFLASMSHEIRTPMNGVIGMTSLLSSTELDEEQQDYVETIRNSGDSLLTIINDILDFSKIEAGQLELEAHRFEIRRCVEDAIDVLALKASQKGLELACLVMPGVPQYVVGDSTRIRQIIVNLVGNGIKFTEHGEVTVFVNTVVNATSDGRDHDSITLHITVKDTGIGIPEEKKNRLFQSFSQVDASITRKYGGTGLGLAISKRLTDLMDGRIWVESEVGAGSKFHVELNVRTEKKGVLPDELNLTGKRVLAVDDNRTNRKILDVQLSAWGMEVVLAASGLEALRLHGQEEPFDLLLLDYQMPGMDGVTLGRMLSKKEKNAVPILMLSSIGTRVEMQSEVAFSSLHKPVREASLKRAIAGLLSNTSNGQQFPKENLDIFRPGQISILLADDNVINQKVLLRILHQIEYKADVVANGEEVLYALNSRTYDILLIDTHMPVMDGFQTSRWIKEKFIGAHRPYIIAISADEDLEDLKLDAHFDDAISKPVKLEHLIAALDKYNPTQVAQAKAVSD